MGDPKKDHWDLVTNQDTSWKMYHPALLMDAKYDACIPYFQQFVDAGGELVFTPWPQGRDFNSIIKKVFPGETKAFYSKMHSVGDPNMPDATDMRNQDIWMKDYAVFCEKGGECRMVSAFSPAPQFNLFETKEEEWWEKRPKLRRQFNEALAKKFNLHIDRTAFRFEGGNFLKLGDRFLIMSTNMMKQDHIPWPENFSHKTGLKRMNSIVDGFERFAGEMKRQVIWLEPLPGEGTEHVDMFMSVVGDTALVGELPQDVIDNEKSPVAKKKLQDIKDTLDRNARVLVNKNIKVKRVPQPPHFTRSELVPTEDFPGRKFESSDYYPSYMNLVQLKNAKGELTAFVPDTATAEGPEQERKWKAKIEKTLTELGAKVKWIPMECAGAIETGFGGMSCVTGACPTPVRRALEQNH